MDLKASCLNRLWGAAAVLALFFGGAGCTCNKSKATVKSASGAQTALPQDLLPDEHTVHIDLLRRAHLAEVYQHGLFVDFGGPAQAKYTVGDWKSGFVDRGTERDAQGNDASVAYTGKRARIYFNLDQVAPHVLRLRVKPLATRAMTPYINNHQLKSHFFENQSLQYVDIQLPAEQLKVGENYFLLSFGGAEERRGKQVAAALASMRVVAGTQVPGGEYKAPTLAELAQKVELDGDTRTALVTAAPAALQFYVQVPRDAKLAFGVGVKALAKKAGKAEPKEVGKTPVQVRIRVEGQPAKELFSEEVKGEWEDELVDLGDYAGKVARLEFRSTKNSPNQIAWSALSILTPQPEESDQPKQAKNVVILLVDTLRAEKLKIYNKRSRVQTPVLDGIAAEGTVFVHAQSPENWTKPSVASVLTGLYPRTHDARTREAVLGKSALMLSEHFKTNGFKTGSFIANGYVSDKFGFDQGWDKYRNFIREEGSTEAENVFKEAGEWVTANKDDRFFLYVQTIDPHVPYDPPQSFLDRYSKDPSYAGKVRARMTPDLLAKAKARPPKVTFDEADVRRLHALHDGEISYHDAELGKFVERLKQLGVWEDTLFVFVSDHGEEFGEHGSWGHGHSVYQELLAVPLVMRFPGGVPKTRVTETVNTMDVAPTVTEFARLPPLPDAEAKSLVGVMRGGSLPGPAIAFSDFMDERRVSVAGRHKFILRGNLTATLFDLEKDPWEKEQLQLGQRPIATRYMRIMSGQFLAARDLGRWIDIAQPQKTGKKLEADKVEMDDALKAQLKQLGYMEDE